MTTSASPAPEETFSHDIFRGLSNSKGQRIYFETQGQNKDAKIVIRIVDNGKEAIYEIAYVDRKCLQDMHSVLNEIDGHATKKAQNIVRVDGLRKFPVPGVEE